MRGKIVVPANPDQLDRFNTYDYINNRVDQIKVDISSEQFYLLKEQNIWQSVNQIAGTMIDDGEEEEITDMMKLEQVKTYLLSYVTQNKGTAESEIIVQLVDLIEEALKRRTGLIFIL